MTRYVQVTARRQGDGWSAHLPELGGLAAPSLVELRAVVESVLPDAVVSVTPKLPLELGGAVADARAVRDAAASLAVRAEHVTAVASARLRGAGLSEADIAVVLGLPVLAVEPVPVAVAPVRRPPGRPRKVQSA